MNTHQSEVTRQNLTSPDISWNWETANYFADWHEPIVELLSRYIPRNTRILEIGAGGSHTLGALANRLNCVAFGLEPDVAGIAKAVELANGENAPVLMVRGDGFSLPFAENSFDVVYSLGLVEHFSFAQSEELIAEHFRVCKAGGRVVVAVPNLLNLPHTLRKAYLGERYEYAPEHSFTPRQLIGMLEGVGLREISTDGLHPLWGLGMSRWGWNVVRLLRRTGIARVLEKIKSPSIRAGLGFMTYAIGKKK
jgi:SAM-dependent methyltransferase